MQYNIQSIYGSPPQPHYEVRARRDGAAAAYVRAIKRACKAAKVDPTPYLERAEAVRDPKCRAHRTAVGCGAVVHFTTLHV